jgi:hypothetical protein
MRALNAPIEINVGDPSFTYTGGPSLMPFRLTANNIKIASYEIGDNNAKVMEMYEDYGFNISGLFQNIVRGISIHAKPTISSPPVGPNWTPTDNSSIYGYIGLQTIEGAIGSTDGSYGQEHAYGTVLIGPTYNTTQSSMIGVPTPQALGISRRITLDGSRDAAIRFMFDGVAGPTAGNVFASTIGTIVPMRIGNTLDALVISAGIGSGLMGNRVTNQGGRIGLGNNALAAFTPQFPMHTRITWDGRVFGGAIGSSPTVGDVNNPWYAGFDYRHKTNPFLVGSTSFQPKNDVGIGFATVAENFNAPSGLTGAYLPMPWIQTYYTEGYDEVPNDGMSGRSQGINAPHLFMQYGPENTSGNIGIGFKPDTVVSSAFAKLSIAGSVTIGSTSGLYHTDGATRRGNSILLEGALIQGATSFINQYNTSVFGSTATAFAYSNNYTVSGAGLIAGRIFLSRGFNGVAFAPDFALPDLKTGIMYDPTAGNEYIGWLTSPRNLPEAIGGPTAPETTATPKRVAKWANRGENGYNNNNQYSSFSVLETFSTKPVTLTTQDLTQQVVNSLFTGGGVLQCSVWEIPVRSSMIFLNLAAGRTGMLRFNTTGSSWVSQVGTATYFLNGFTDPLPTSGNIATRPVGFSLEDGHYDGQTLSLTILDVNEYNTGPLLPNRPAYTGNLQVSVSPSAEFRDDNIIMSAEPFSNPGSGITADDQGALLTMPLTLLPTARISANGFNDAYPMPFGPVNSTAPFTTGITLPVLGSQLNANGAKWTNISRMSGAFAPAIGSFGNFNGSGFGTFYIIPYRTIRFVWRFDSSSGIAGKWFELGRENLVKPSNRTWDPSNYSDGAGSAPPGGGDDGGGDDGPPIEIDDPCCFVAGTLISMSDGSFKAIEDIVVGDKVLSVLDGTQEIIENEIRGTIEVVRSSLCTVTLDNGATFTVSHDHPIWVEGKGWSSIDPAKSEIAYPGIVLIGSEVLSVGDTLFGIDDKPKIISIVDAGLINEKVYTLGTIDRKASNYIANGILAHNVKFDPEDNPNYDPTQEDFLCAFWDDPLMNP